MIELNDKLRIFLGWVIPVFVFAILDVYLDSESFLIAFVTVWTIIYVTRVIIIE